MEKLFEEFDINRALYKEMEYDSRKIKAGDIFVALKGATVDGHNYIKTAVDLGAIAVLHSEAVQEIPGIKYFKIPDLRENLGKIASEFYGYPQDKLKIVGITGTNGKTTTSYLIESILGKDNVARIGTVEYKIGKEIIEAPNTTPESLDLIKFCKMAVERGIEYLVMEISSHALVIGRVNMLKLDTAVFTNLTPEHLDFHNNMEEYYLAKKKIFTMLKESRVPVINCDDSYGERYYETFKGISYGIENGELRGNYTENMTTVKFTYKGKKSERKIKLLGRYNLYNILGAAGAALALGIPWEKVMEEVEKLQGAPGRFETVECGQNFTAIVDYAHTGDALENLLKTVKEMNFLKVITVFGCGGDRDRKKRPEMGKIAEQYSDLVILTSDNPRTEEPHNILEEVKTGFVAPEKVLVLPERDEAIATAVKNAVEGSIIVVAGKGHETYQILGTKKIHFDDKEYLRREIVRKKEGK